MNYVVNGLESQEIFSYQDVGTLLAINGGLISHEGNAEDAVAYYGSRIDVIGGDVTSRIHAFGESTIAASGNPTVVSASEGSRVFLSGDPEVAIANGRSSVTVFGQPQRVKVSNGGNMTIISPSPDYVPDQVSMDRQAKVSLIFPGLFERGGNIPPPAIVHYSGLLDELATRTSMETETHSHLARILSTDGNRRTLSSYVIDSYLAKVASSLAGA
jgi:hypothetical protein